MAFSMSSIYRARGLLTRLETQEQDDGPRDRHRKKGGGGRNRDGAVAPPSRTTHHPHANESRGSTVPTSPIIAVPCLGPGDGFACSACLASLNQNNERDALYGTKRANIVLHDDDGAPEGHDDDDKKKKEEEEEGEEEKSAVKKMDPCVLALQRLYLRALPTDRQLRCSRQYWWDHDGE